MLGLAAAHFFAGHFDDTVNMTGRILIEVPSHNVARRYRAAALAHLGRIDEAKAVIADLVKGNLTLICAAPAPVVSTIRGWPNFTFLAWKRPACRSDLLRPLSRRSKLLAQRRRFGR
jgi:hypothetical protein